MRQVVEGALVHRGTDLPLDKRPADPVARWLGRIGSLRITFDSSHLYERIEPAA